MAETEAKKYDLDRVVRLVIALVCIGLGIYLINYLSSVLLPFLVGCVLAYMLNPIVEFFKKILFMKNRIIPSILTLVLFFGVIYLVVRYLFPYVAKEFGEMGELLSAYAQAELKGREIPVEITQFINDYLKSKGKTATHLRSPGWAPGSGFVSLHFQKHPGPHSNCFSS